MSRRSPSNARYQKFTVPEGKTRKSAAAAKPIRKEGGSATSSSSKSKSKTESKAQGKFVEPNTPEYKFWRRAWWISLGLGLLFVALSFYIQYYMKAVGTLRTVGVVTIMVAYACIIAAFFIDYKRMRPMRMGTYVSNKPTDGTSTPSDPS